MVSVLSLPLHEFLLYNITTYTYVARDVSWLLCQLCNINRDPMHQMIDIQIYVHHHTWAICPITGRLISSIFPGRTVSYWTPFLWCAHDHREILILMTDEEWWMAYNALDDKRALYILDMQRMTASKLTDGMELLVVNWIIVGSTSVYSQLRVHWHGTCKQHTAETDGDNGRWRWCKWLHVVGAFHSSSS